MNMYVVIPKSRLVEEQKKKKDAIGRSFVVAPENKFYDDAGNCNPIHFIVVAAVDKDEAVRKFIRKVAEKSIGVLHFAGVDSNDELNAGDFEIYDADDLGEMVLAPTGCR